LNKFFNSGLGLFGFFCWSGTFPKHQAIPAHSEQTDTDSLHLTTQSGPDSQTVRPLARNNASDCNAAPSHGRHTGFVGGKAGMRYPLPWFLLSDGLEICYKNRL